MRLLQGSFRIVFQDIQSGELSVGAGRLRMNLKKFIKYFSRLLVATEANQDETLEMRVGELQRICGGNFAEERVRFLELTLRDQGGAETEQGGHVARREFARATPISLCGSEVEARNHGHSLHSHQRIDRLPIKGVGFVRCYSRTGQSLLSLIARVTHTIIPHGYG